MLLTGLVSVTFRQKTPEEVLNCVEAAGLEAIEWGGDIHVPAGDLAAARQVGNLTRARHLAIPTYGSYYRAGVPADEQKSPPFQAVLATAAELGAGGIRVWTHLVSSQKASADQWARTIEDLARIRDLAAAKGLLVYLEYHNNTLNDRDASTRRLLEAVDGIYTFWQPLNELTRDENIKTLAAARIRLAHLHVFSDQGSSCLLETGEQDWQTYFGLLPEQDSLPARPDQPRCLMIEFVKDQSEDSLLADARTLRAWIRSRTGMKSPDPGT